MKQEQDKYFYFVPFSSCNIALIWCNNSYMWVENLQYNTLDYFEGEDEFENCNTTLGFIIRRLKNCKGYSRHDENILSKVRRISSIVALGRIGAETFKKCNHLVEGKKERLFNFLNLYDRSLNFSYLLDKELETLYSRYNNFIVSPPTSQMDVVFIELKISSKTAFLVIPFNIKFDTHVRKDKWETSKELTHKLFDKTLLDNAQEFYYDLEKIIYRYMIDNPWKDKENFNYD